MPFASLGRTEDLRFSPDNRHLAVASLSTNRIVVFEVCIDASSSAREIALTDVVEISSQYIRRPHGIDFLDNEKIIVANREGDATIFELPSVRSRRKYELEPLGVIHSPEILNTPGSVSITRKNQNLYEAFICNNYAHRVTRHLIDLSDGVYLRKNEILLNKWLAIPDGIAVNSGWIAVSNHNTRNVLLYKNTASLNNSSDPDGILRCIHYPHGLKFTCDGNFLLVADAGAPYVHIYRAFDAAWQGVRKPLKSLKILKNEDFLRGRGTIYDGGPKGIDIDNSMSTFVTTCKRQPLAFFNLAKIIRDAGTNVLPVSRETLDVDQLKLEVNYELDTMPCSSLDELKHEINIMMNTRSWRFTAPLRWIVAHLKNLTVTRGM